MPADAPSGIRRKLMRGDAFFSGVGSRPRLIVHYPEWPKPCRDTAHRPPGANPASTQYLLGGTEPAVPSSRTVARDSGRATSAKRQGSLEAALRRRSPLAEYGAIDFCHSFLLLPRSTCSPDWTSGGRDRPLQEPFTGSCGRLILRPFSVLFISFWLGLPRPRTKPGPLLKAPIKLFRAVQQRRAVAELASNASGPCGLRTVLRVCF